jgi:hypothetical protein
LDQGPEVKRLRFNSDAYTKDYMEYLVLLENVGIS